MIFPEGIKVFGDKSYRNKKSPSEANEQATFFNQLRLKYPNCYGAVAIHIKNEGKKTAQQVAKDKAQGMVSGAPDIIIPGNPAFLCELKRRDHTDSKLQPGQVPYLIAAHKLGAFVCIALGWEAAMEAFEQWRASTTN